MFKVLRALPVFFAGLFFTLLVVPAYAGDTTLEQVRAALADYEQAGLQIEWNDGMLVLDGEVAEEDIDRIVSNAARVDGVNTIVNKLYLS